MPGEEIRIQASKWPLIAAVPILAVGLFFLYSAIAELGTNSPDWTLMLIFSTLVSAAFWYINRVLRIVFGPAQVVFNRKGITIRNLREEPFNWVDIQELNVAENRFWFAKKIQASDGWSADEQIARIRSRSKIVYGPDILENQLIAGLDYVGGAEPGGFNLTEPDFVEVLKFARTHLPSEKVIELSSPNGTVEHDLVDRELHIMKERLSPEEWSELERKRREEPKMEDILKSIKKIIQEDKQSSKS